jgi:hypothetical protein
MLRQDSEAIANGRHHLSHFDNFYRCFKKVTPVGRDAAGSWLQRPGRFGAARVDKYRVLPALAISAVLGGGAIFSWQKPLDRGTLMQPH